MTIAGSPKTYTSVEAGQAVSYTFTGPATAPIGVASSLFTIRPTSTPTLTLSGSGASEVGTYSNAGTFTGTIRIEDSRGGYTDYNFSGSTPQTFSVTADNSTPGTSFTLTPTCTSGGLSNPAPLTVTRQTLTTIDSSWLADIGNGGPNGPYQLNLDNRYYKLATDITVPNGAFEIHGLHVTIDGDNHTITYDQSTTVTVTNSGFETGDFTGWDVTGASGATVVAAEVGMSGSYMARVSTTYPTIKTFVSPSITLPETNRPYRAGIASIRGHDYYGIVRLSIVDPSDNSTLQFPLAGTMEVTNGLKLVTGSGTHFQTAGNMLGLNYTREIIFASQPGVVYGIESVGNDDITLTLTTAYTGTTDLSTSATTPATQIRQDVSGGWITHVNFQTTLSAIKLKFEVMAVSGHTIDVDFDDVWCCRTGISGINTNIDNNPNCLIWLRNLNIVQGTAKSGSEATTTQSAAVKAVSTTMDMDNVNITAGSVDSCLVYQNYSNGCIVKNSTFVSQMVINSNRQAAQQIYYLANCHGVIDFTHNTLSGTHQNGLGVGGYTAITDLTYGRVMFNDIRQDSRWTDGYCLGMGSYTYNTEVAYNTFKPVSGRGIIFSGIGYDTIDHVHVHDNYVSCVERGNLEYGQVGLIVTALRARTYTSIYSNIEIDHNRFYAYTGIGTGIPPLADQSAAAVRVSLMNSGQLNNISMNIHDNIFKAIIVEQDPGLGTQEAWASSWPQIDAGTNIVLTNNTYESNVVGINFGDSDGTDEYDITFMGSTIIHSSEGESRSFITIRPGNYNAITTNIKFIDSVYQGGATPPGTFVGSAAKDLEFGWTLNLTVTHLGDPVNGATVTITDTNGSGTVQFSGTTNVNGQCLAIPLTSDKYTSDGTGGQNSNPIHTSYNQFSVHAESGSWVGTQLITMSTPAQTLSLPIATP